MCCQHRDRDTCGMWNTRTWFSSACGACFHMRWPGVSSGTCCTWCNKPRRGCWRWQLGTFGVVLSHTLQTKEVRLLEKKPGANVPGVVNHKLWRSQLRELVPHMPVHSGRSPQVVVVAQELDGLAVLPGDGTQTSPAPELVPATFGQPLAEFLGVVLAAWYDGTRGQDSHFVLQQVEERDKVVKVVHEQHMVLVGDLRVLHEMVDNTAG